MDGRGNQAGTYRRPDGRALPTWPLGCLCCPKPGDSARCAGFSGPPWMLPSTHRTDVVLPPRQRPIVDRRSDRTGTSLRAVTLTIDSGRPRTGSRRNVSTPTVLVAYQRSRRESPAALLDQVPTNRAALEIGHRAGRTHPARNGDGRRRARAADAGVVPRRRRAPGTSRRSSPTARCSLASRGRTCAQSSTCSPTTDWWWGGARSTCRSKPAGPSPGHDTPLRWR